jgi:hypothetical protein
MSSFSADLSVGWYSAFSWCIALASEIEKVGGVLTPVEVIARCARGTHRGSLELCDKLRRVFHNVESQFVVSGKPDHLPAQ